MIYLPVLVMSIAVMMPAIIVAEKYRRMKGVFVGAVAALLVSQVMLYARRAKSLCCCSPPSSCSSPPST